MTALTTAGDIRRLYRVDSAAPPSESFNLMVEHPLDATYAAISHPARRAMLERLVDGPARVTDLARPFALSLNAVSKHLKTLERAGLVRRDVRGRDHWLELAPQPLGAATGWLELYRRFWESRLDRLETMLREDSP
jgi:DNA-binding transcriptional ArsR family regulator